MGAGNSNRGEGSPEPIHSIAFAGGTEAAVVLVLPWWAGEGR